MTGDPVTCRCGAVLVGTPHLPPACGHCGRPTPARPPLDPAPPASSPPADPIQRLPDYVARRYRICQACPHITDGYRCGLIVSGGRPGLLFHSRGLWRAESHCPDDRW